MSNVRQFPDALIDAIYSGLIEESPWIKALELLRVASESNVACLRISAWIGPTGARTRGL